MKSNDLFLLYEKEVAEFKLELIRKLSGDTGLPGKTRARRTSILSMTEGVLKAAGRPLHVSEIIAAVEKEFGVTIDRDSLSSAIIKQVRKEKRFVRVGPNTFGLKQT